ncbi:MAG: ParB/RepB/Spo0J family partition protein [Desulfobacterales bacterium]|jgi:ParB family chromosome partitioning protein|nr:ParB/RepB/Spo0J family partition protein [Desulfobacterales bacterium]
MGVTTDNQRDEDAKKKRKPALGRGLESLIPLASSGENATEGAYLLSDISLIRPNRYQPRRRFDEAELAQLCESIREQGVLQPLLVRRDGIGYELIAGERRLRASKMANLKQVPVLVKDISDEELLELSIIENIQREDLNPLDEAEAYHLLMSEFGLTQEEAAKRVGKSRPAVANSLRLRQLPDQIKQSILENKLSMGHARALLGAESPARQLAAWRTVITKGLSVRQTEALVRRLKKELKPPDAFPETSTEIHLAALAETLSRRFGTRVTIQRKGKKGKVAIDFFSDEDLTRLLEILQRI